MYGILFKSVLYKLWVIGYLAWPGLLNNIIIVFHDCYPMAMEGLFSCYLLAYGMHLSLKL